MSGYAEGGITEHYQHDDKTCECPFQNAGESHLDCEFCGGTRKIHYHVTPKREMISNSRHFDRLLGMLAHEVKKKYGTRRIGRLPEIGVMVSKSHESQYRA